jgi:hypothetical protein
MLAFGATSVPGVHCSELTVVHARWVALTKPYSDGLAMISLRKADVLNWITCTPDAPIAELSVVLKIVCDSAVNSCCALRTGGNGVGRLAHVRQLLEDDVVGTRRAQAHHLRREIERRLRDAALH